MAERREQDEAPRAQGDPIGDAAADANPEDNRAQRQSDAPSDLIGGGREGRGDEESERAGGRGSDANGITADDEADGERRKRLYREGAEIVSRMD
ncbi:MAG TPA: hypothetical protein VF147_11290 [Vicinamibacterales bacterium]